MILVTGAGGTTPRSFAAFARDYKVAFSQTEP